MNYRQEYERWLSSDALSASERAELQGIALDEKEIENRFYGPLEFGTAGLRGTMAVGLHNMNMRQRNAQRQRILLRVRRSRGPSQVLARFLCRTRTTSKQALRKGKRRANAEYSLY